MAKKLLLLLIVFVFSFSSTCQTLLTKAGGSANDAALAIDTDASGNSYLTGFIGGASQFGSLTSSQYSAQDIFVAKMGSSGDFLWVKVFGGSNVERALDIKVDNSGSLYITGYFFGNASFGSVNLSSNSASRDLFVAKLDANTGNVDWALNEGGSDAETGHSITFDNAGNVLVCAQFEGTVNIGSNSYTTPINSFTNNLAQGILLIKYDANGNLLWSKSGISDFNNLGISISIDANDHIYMTGNYSDDLTLAGNLYSNQQLNAGFLTKFTPEGNVVWFKKMAASTVNPVTVKTGSSNNLYFTGNFQGNLIFYGPNNNNDTIYPNYSNNLFLIKADTSGTFTWGESLGSDADLMVRDMVIDNAENQYLTGVFKCNFDEIRINEGTAFYTSIGENDIFTVKYSQSGSKTWGRHQGGLGNDEVYGISKSSTSNFPVVCGTFKENFYVAINGAPSFPSYISTSDQLTANGCTVNHGLATGNNLDILIYNPFQSLSQDGFNYYVDPTGLCVDSMSCYIIPDVDSLEGCYPFNLTATSAFMNNGPPSTFSWNGVPGLSTYNASSTGDYILEENRGDGCGTSSDTIHVNILPSPPTLWLTDDESINVQDDPYSTIYLCSPDSVNIQLDDVPTGMDFNIMYNGQEFSDTNFALLTEEGSYIMELTNDFGCSSSQTLAFVLDSTDYDSLVPYLSLDPIVANDSVSLCEGESISVYALDSITNPTGIIEVWDGAYLEAAWNDSPYDSINNYSEFQQFFWPDSTGWQVIQFSVVIGYDNSCGTYRDTLTVVDSFFVEVLAMPISNINLEASILICPGGTGVIVADTSFPSFTWSGPGIVSISPDNQEIVVDQAGGYVLQGTLSNPNSGCSQSYFLTQFISVKPIPEIISSNDPAFICPGDSIQLSISPGISYNWIGPNGNSVGNTQSIYVTDNGEYYCIVMDDDSCEFVTESVMVTEYTTPDLNIIGTPALCEGDSLTLEVEFYGNPIFLWQPTGDTTASIVVDSAGVYYCYIELCGITTQDSISVIDGSIQAQLNINDTLFCPGDSIYISATQGFSSYTWDPVNDTTAGFYTSQPGNYFVTVENNYGCTENTDTVNVGYFLGNELMDFEDTTLCIGDTASFSYTGNGSIEWYLDNNLLSSNDIVEFPDLSTPFTLVYTIDRPYCGLYTDSFDISLSDLPPNFTFPIGDEYCHNDTLVLSINENADTYTWTNESNQSFAGNNHVLFPIDETFSGTYIINASNQFCTSIDSIDIIVYPSFTLELNDDTSFICENDTREVYDLYNDYNLLEWEFENSFYTSDDTLLVDPIFEDGYYILTGLDTNNCPFIEDSTMVYNTNNHNFFVQLDTAACLGVDLVLFADEIPNTSFYWTLPDGSNNFDATVEIFNLDSTDAGWYNVEITVFSTCDFNDSLYLDVYAPQIFDIGNDTLICRKEFFGIYAPDNLNNWTWENGTNTEPYMVYNNINYIYLTNQDANGCFYTDTMILELSDCTPIIPNVITVNGDGMNDYLIIQNSEKHPRNRLEIINRWGNPIYEKDQYKNNFDGKGLTPGTYFYIYYEDTSDENSEAYTGFVEIRN